MKGNKNDCVTLAQNHLSNMVYYQKFLDNAAADMEDIRHRLESVPVAVSHYGIDGTKGSGGDGMTGVEAEAERRILLMSQLVSLEKSTTETASLLGKLEAAIMLLPKLEKDVVETVYKNGIRIEKAKDIHHMSERTCRRVCRQAVCKIAVTLYGAAAAREIFFARAVE